MILVYLEEEKRDQGKLSPHMRREDLMSTQQSMGRQPSISQRGHAPNRKKKIRHM